MEGARLVRLCSGLHASAASAARSTAFDATVTAEVATRWGLSDRQVTPCRSRKTEIWPESRIRCAHRFTQRSTLHLATVLDKELKRQVAVDGVDYTVAVDPEGLRLTGKGKRKPEVELRWRDLLSGDAAMAIALNASLSKKRQATTKPATDPSPDRAGQRKKRSR